jgi:multimeric flavodoxin WrbA
MSSPESLSRLLIVYHSQSGRTERLAQEIAMGARTVEGIAVDCNGASHVTAEDLRDCKVLVICSPEYFGYMAGGIKDLFDRTYEGVREHTIGKPYAVAISAGNDGTGALQSIERLILGYRMRKVQEPIVVRGPIGPDDLARCRELGQTLAAGMDLGIY